MHIVGHFEVYILLSWQAIQTIYPPSPTLLPPPPSPTDLFILSVQRDLHNRICNKSCGNVGLQNICLRNILAYKINVCEIYWLTKYMRAEYRLGKYRLEKYRLAKYRFVEHRLPWFLLQL